MQISRLQSVRRRLHARLQPGLAPQPHNPAMVFAPHQDDETLGCGGTIILKRRANTPVHIAFLTDGSTSHRAFMGASELKDRREEEAILACRTLGVPEHSLHFLRYPDSALRLHRHHAVNAVSELLSSSRPAEIFVPYQRDGTADHEATYNIIIDALRTINYAPRVFEYPIWVWNRWPWVRFRPRFNREGLREFLGICSSSTRRYCTRTFNCGVHVHALLEQKRQALLCHRSQMTALVPGVPWPTLSEISGGDFLDCFFQEYEIFRRQVPSLPRV